MIACSTLASLVLLSVLVVLTASARPSPMSVRRRWYHARSQLDDVLRTKVEELEKLGVTPDEVARYIQRMRRADPRQLTVLTAALSSLPSTSQRLDSERNLLVRHFIRNRTVTCNDGSPAGSVIDQSIS